jgi:hypothetical protein
MEFIFTGVESKLGPLGTSATSDLLYLPRVIVKMKTLVEWRLAEKTEVLGGKLPSVTLSTTNPTWPDAGSKSGHRGGEPETNRLSYAVPFTDTKLVS